MAVQGGGLGPLPEMPLFDVITADVTRASPGDMFFVHLLTRIIRTCMTRRAISARCESGSSRETRGRRGTTANPGQDDMDCTSSR